MKKVTIIAEAGVNHNGDLQKAMELVEVAAEAGADFIKFQSFKADKLVTAQAKKANYQIENFGEDHDLQLPMLRKLELSDEDHLSLIEFCKSRQIQFFSTAFDLDGLDFLHSLGFNLFKIPSGEITNYPYLKKIAVLKRPVILSTGMSFLGEIESALKVLTSEGLSREAITVLHCNTEYPTPMQDVNLRAMQTIKQAFNVSVGYSDHTMGIEVPLAAVALGASVIEKHITLDRTLPGPDHRASIEPDELRQMVSRIRNLEMALSGSGLKEPSPSELKNKVIARKSIVASKPIKKGESFNRENLTTKRPGSGISPMLWHKVIGSPAKRDFLADELIEI